MRSRSGLPRCRAADAGDHLCALKYQIVRLGRGIRVGQNWNAWTPEVTGKQNPHSFAVANVFEKNEGRAQNVPSILKFDIGSVTDRFAFIESASFEVFGNVLRIGNGIEWRNWRIWILKSNRLSASIPFINELCVLFLKVSGVGEHVLAKLCCGGRRVNGAAKPLSQ